MKSWNMHKGKYAIYANKNMHKYEKMQKYAKY